MLSNNFIFIQIARIFINVQEIIFHDNHKISRTGNYMYTKSTVGIMREQQLMAITHVGVSYLICVDQVQERN